MRKHLLAVLMVSFCVNSAFSSDQKTLEESYNKARDGYFYKNKPSRLESGKKQIPKRTQIKKIKDTFRRLLNKTGLSRNNLPTAGGTFYYGTQTSGEYPVFQFSTAEEMADSDGHITYVRWDFGDGSAMEIPAEELNNRAEIDHVFSGLGTYNVSLKIYDDAGEFTEFTQTLNVVNNMAPTAYFTHIRTTVNNVNFTAIANDPENAVEFYRWDFGDNSSPQEGPSATISHNFPAAGAYWVTLRVRDQTGAQSEFRKHVYVRQVQPTTILPYPVVKVNKVAGPGPLMVNFDSSLSVDSRDRLLTLFEWDFGDFDSTNNYSKSATPTHTYKAPGTYFVRLRAKDRYNNIKEHYLSIHVRNSTNAQPLVFAKQNDKSRFIQFDGSHWAFPVPVIPGQTFWNFGDGTTAQGEFVQHQYPVDGKYTVRVVTHDVQGKRHITLHDIVVTNQQDSPEARFYFNAKIQDIGGTYFYNAEESQDPGQNAPLTYTWDFNDGTIISGSQAQVEHSYATRGNYPVHLTITNSRGLSREAQDDVSVRADSYLIPDMYYTPKIGNAPLHVNFKSDLAFSSQGTVEKIVWQFNDDTYSEATSLSRDYTEPGFYWAKLYVKDNFGNEAVSFREIVVLNPTDIPPNNEVPVPYFKIEKVGPAPSDLAFKAYGTFDPDGYVQFLEWRLDNVLKTDGWEFNPQLTPGTHSVRLTARDQWNGNVSLTKTFKVGTTNDANLDFTFTPTAPLIAEQVTFSAVNTVVTGIEYKKYKWDFGDGTVGSGEVDQHTYAAAGTYTVKLSVTDLEGQTHNLTQDVTVTP